MSKYGLKILNYSAGAIYEYNLRVRDHYDTKKAMLTNSLFLDFLLENGLNVWKGESTRDVICIEFKYGSSSYEQHRKKLEKTLNNKNNPPSQEKIDKINEVLKNIEMNKGRYRKKNVQSIRDEFYVNGVDIEYKTRDKDGNTDQREKIHYKMLYRTPGKAKNGSCIFINETLYDKALDFIRMGIEMPYENAPIVEIGAYSSLVTSSIVDRIKIEPEHILVLKDVDSFFETNIVSVEIDENKHCVAKNIDGYKLKNTLFDGQALIDTSIFPEWGDGYILLRHHFCKMAAFASNIQTFFRDYFGNDYEKAMVVDMFGNEHCAKDIKLITTDNAMKWLKFDVSYEYWCDRVKQNGALFGIVKTAHQSKMGEVQRMSYQMINSLELDIMPDVVDKSIQYINSLKQDDEVFLQYLKDNINYMNDFSALIDLCEQNPDFVRSKYFRERKYSIINTYILNLKNGRVIQDADNLVIVGSPYAMLLHSVGEDINKDDTFCQEDGAIQCYTERFGDGEYLAEFRSPFNSKNNLGYMHNVYHEKFNEYFKLGKQIIAVNMIGTDAQSRNNGADQDSDSLYVTNQKNIVEYAKYCYKHYPTIENNIPKEKNNYNNTLIDFSTIDNNLAAANMAIGESSNLAQLCLTYTYNFPDQKYQDYVCILSVLAQCAIDNAKRRFDIDLNEEISRIKKDMNIQENGLPSFWKIIKPDNFKGKTKEKTQAKLNKINYELKCPMNYLYDIPFNKYRSEESTLSMDYFFNKFDLDKKERRKSKKVEELIEKYSIELYSHVVLHDDDEHLLLRNDFENMINDIQRIHISKNYLPLMSWLLDRAFVITPAVKRNEDAMCSNLSKNKVLLINTLYNVNKEAFLMCFAKK